MFKYFKPLFLLFISLVTYEYTLTAQVETPPLSPIATVKQNVGLSELETFFLKISLLIFFLSNNNSNNKSLDEEFKFTLLILDNSMKSLVAHKISEKYVLKRLFNFIMERTKYFLLIVNFLI